MRIDILFWTFFIILEFILTLRFSYKIYAQNNVTRFKILMLFLIVFCNYFTVLNFGFNKILLRQVVLFIITLVFPLFLGNKNYFKNIFISIIFSTGLFLISSLSSFIWIEFFRIPLNDIRLFIIVKSLQLLYILLLIKVAPYINCIPNVILFLLALLFVVIRFLILILIIFSNSYSEQFGYILLSVTFSLFIVYILIILTVVKFSTYLEIYAEDSSKNDMFKYLSQYKDTTLNAFQEMKVWNHDLKNHMSIMLSLLESNSEQDLRKYIDKLNIETSKLEDTIYSNNLIVDSLLNNKIKYAKENNIEIKLDISFKQTLSMDELDIVILLSNLLDNAIESCEKIPDNRWIEICLKTENNKFLIKIKNPTDGNLNNTNFKTNKNSEDHGIGLLQIDKITNKYNGYINRVHNDNIFNTTILLINI